MTSCSGSTPRQPSTTDPWPRSHPFPPQHHLQRRKVSSWCVVGDRASTGTGPCPRVGKALGSGPSLPRTQQGALFGRQEVGRGPGQVQVSKDAVICAFAEETERSPESGGTKFLCRTGLLGGPVALQGPTALPAESRRGAPSPEGRQPCLPNSLCIWGHTPPLTQFPSQYNGCKKTFPVVLL